MESYGGVSITTREFHCELEFHNSEQLSFGIVLESHMKNPLYYCAKMQQNCALGTLFPRVKLVYHVIITIALGCVCAKI